MILITGPTGNVGSALMEALAGRGDVRALTRSEESAARLRARGAEAYVGSYDDISGALDGVDRMFLLSPAGAEEMAATQKRAVDAAREAGVRHVVKLSSIAADEPTSARIIAAHREVERHIETSGLAWTHLRPHWFMQNELGAIGADAVHAPDVTRISMVDARDVGAAAARVLTERGHEGREYVLTGPEAISYVEVAAALSVPWKEVTLEQARDSMLEGGLPEVLAVGFTEIMARYREGGVTRAVSGDLRRLLGRDGTTFEAFAREHAPVAA